MLSGICVLFRVLLGIVMSFIAIIVMYITGRKKVSFFFSFSANKEINYKSYQIRYKSVIVLFIVETLNESIVDNME